MTAPNHASLYNSQGVDPRILEVVEYRKSGLSLNHIVGCPLDCAYCVRHLFANFDMKQPRALMSDEDGFKALVENRYFQPDVTPLQLLNRATDPFLATVKPHTFAIIEMLDAAGLRNHLALITRYKVTQEDCRRLNLLRNLRVTLLITHSGIDDDRIEPIDSSIAAESLKLAFSRAEAYRTILYWRPILPGVNDSLDHLARAVELSRHAHATVFTGLFYRKEMKEFFDSHGLPQLSASIARRKIMPLEAEHAFFRLSARPANAAPSSVKPLAESPTPIMSTIITAITALENYATSALPSRSSAVVLPGRNQTSVACPH